MHEVAAAEIPHHPLPRVPLQEDINGDGILDVVLWCTDGLRVFTAEQSVGSEWVTVAWLLQMAALGVHLWLQSNAHRVPSTRRQKQL